MSKKNNSIHVVGSEQNAISTIDSIISTIPDFNVTTSLITSDKQNSWLSFSENYYPEIIVFLLNQDNSNELQSLCNIASSKRPALLVIAPTNDRQLMRLSIQMGARDFICEPVVSDELKSSLVHIQDEQRFLKNGKGKLTSVINAKGGSGASLLACNLAHISASASNSSSILLDLDLQFGTQSLQLDIRPKHTIVEVLNNIQSIDISALEGYTSQHDSGLRLLSTRHEQVILPGEIPACHLETLLHLSLAHYDQTFVDLPRNIDPFTAMVLSNSDKIVLVVQQSLAHLRDAKRLIKIIISDLDIPLNKIHIVINRFSAESSIQVNNIKESLNIENISKIPNDYDRVASAANLGVPLLSFAKHADITQSILTLAEILDVPILDRYKKPSYWKRFKSFF